MNEESKEGPAGHLVEHMGEINHEMQFDPNDETNFNQQNDEEGTTHLAPMHILGPEEGIFYKLGNPIHPIVEAVDWTVTLSRNDFPWHEIAFENFTPKECFEKYTSIVKDPQTFLKKVLGLKEKYKKMMECQMTIMPGGGAVGNMISSAGQVENPAVYCRCKGAIVSELFVKCDGDQECANGSWLHPQCTTDLKFKSKAELDAMEEWYCEDCIARIQREDAGFNDEEEDVPDYGDEDIDINIDLEEDDANDEIMVDIEDEQQPDYGEEDEDFDADINQLEQQIKDMENAPVAQDINPMDEEGMQLDDESGEDEDSGSLMSDEDGGHYDGDLQDGHYH